MSEINLDLYKEDTDSVTHWIDLVSISNQSDVCLVYF